MHPWLGREMVIQAVLIALWQRTTAAGVVLHSDHGTQYRAFKELLNTNEIVSSMNGIRNCYDNAFMEDFFRLLIHT